MFKNQNDLKLNRINLSTRFIILKSLQLFLKLLQWFCTQKHAYFKGFTKNCNENLKPLQ